MKCIIFLSSEVHNLNIAKTSRAFCHWTLNVDVELGKVFLLSVSLTSFLSKWKIQSIRSKLFENFVFLWEKCKKMWKK